MRLLLAPTTRSPALLLLAVGTTMAFCACGQDKATPAADAVTTDSAVPADGAATDAGADTQVATPDTAKPDTGPTPDTAVGLECAEVLPCVAKCATEKDSGTCLTACGADASAEGKKKLSDFAGCAAKDCKAAGPGAPWTACIAEKCFDALATCGDWSGANSCAISTGCIARCAFNDDACRFACLPKLVKADAAKFGALMACGAEKCGTLATADEITGCLADKCGAQTTACKAEGWNCTQLATCLAKCPPQTPTKPNACPQTCKLLATADGMAKEQKLTACKVQCKEGVNYLSCVGEKCGTERLACFVDDGKDTCNMVYKCVLDKCKGLGGDEACISGCVAQGSSVAKDGWVYYEGCMTLQLESDQAKINKCSFPYDLNTCINQISGFCSSQSNACFKP